MPLSPRQIRFVAEYLVDLNGTQAAIRAGYSPRSANVQAARQLAKDSVKAAIQEGQRQQVARVGLSAERTKEAIRRVIEADVRTLFDAQGNVIPIHQLGDEAASLIAGFEVVKRNLTAGDGTTDTILKVKLKDQSRYVEMAAKHFGLLTEKVEHSGDLTIRHELPE